MKQKTFRFFLDLMLLICLALAGCGLPGAVLFVPGGSLLRAPGRRVKFSTRQIPPRKTPQGDLLF